MQFSQIIANVESFSAQTRWKDNDQYLHLNNAVYHALFDTVINVYLIRYHLM